jgi:hypothetical protein
MTRTRTDAIIDYYTPRPAELEAYDKAYARLDSISGVIGVTPTKPVPGEMPHQYRARLLKQVQAKSAKYKDQNFAGALHGYGLDYIEDAVYQDAVDTANDPMSVPRGEVRVLQYRDPAFRLITKTIGQEPLWMEQFQTGPAICIIRRPEK